MEQVGRCAVLLESLLTDINSFSNPQDLLVFRRDFGFANGTGANQADKRWSSAGRSLGSTASESLDLAGSLLDYRGNVITFVRIKAIAIFNNGPNMIQVGAGSNPLLNWIGATGDILRVLNSAAGTITYDIGLLGASA